MRLTHNQVYTHMEVVSLKHVNGVLHHNVTRTAFSEVNVVVYAFLQHNPSDVSCAVAWLDHAQRVAPACSDLCRVLPPPKYVSGPVYLSFAEMPRDLL